jgi:hypothetical protein
MEKLNNIFRNGELNEYILVNTPADTINKLLSIGAISPTHDYIKNKYFEKGDDGKYRLTNKGKTELL